MINLSAFDSRLLGRMLAVVSLYFTQYVFQMVSFWICFRYSLQKILRIINWKPKFTYLQIVLVYSLKYSVSNPSLYAHCGCGNSHKFLWRRSAVLFCLFCRLIKSPRYFARFWLQEKYFYLVPRAREVWSLLKWQ